MHRILTLKIKISINLNKAVKEQNNKKSIKAIIKNKKF